MTQDLEVSLAERMVDRHLAAEHKEKAETTPSTSNSVKPEKVKRPEVGLELSEEKWAYFIDRWTGYKTACNLSGDDLLSQLKECMDEGLREDHFNQFSGVETGTEVDLLKQIKIVAVKKANRAVGRDQLSKLKQERGEPVRKFVGRIRTLAQVAEYQVKCSCEKLVHYTDLVVKDQAIAGLVDQTVKTDVLSHDKVNEWTLEELLHFVEGREAGKMSVGLLGGKEPVGAVNQKKPEARNRPTHQARCPKCDRGHNKDKVCPADNLECFNCGLKGHVARVCRKKKTGGAKSVEEKKDASEDKEEVGGVMADNHWLCNVNFIGNKDNSLYCVDERRHLDQALPCKERRHLPSRKHHKTPVKSKVAGLVSLLGVLVTGTAVLGVGVDKPRGRLDHHVHDGSGWKRSAARGKPMITLKAEVSLSSYDDLGLTRPRVLGDKIMKKFMADTGASITIAGMSFIRELGLREEDLLEPGW